MITVTHNDLCGEMLASVRRGPFSPPTETEQVEYLFQRVASSTKRPRFDEHGLEHVLWEIIYESVSVSFYVVLCA